MKLDVNTDTPAGAGAAQPPVAYVVVVRKGPTWEPDDLRSFCELLSQRFAGEVWAFGSYDADIRIDRIRLRVVNESSSLHLVNVLRFTRHTLRWIEELRRAGHSKLAVISTEPLRAGLLALYAARRAGGVFICEVNGVYGNRTNLNAARAPWAWPLRRLIITFVLARATAVRLLFPGQLAGLIRVPPRVAVGQFFELSGAARFYPGTEEPLVLAVGFPFKVKGFDILCEAFKRVTPRFPNWKLVLIGHLAPQELREGGLEHPQIQALPGLRQRDVAQWVSRCAIFALPSRTEAMGRVLLEAGAAAKCRLATRVDGIPTVIEDEVDGVLVDKESVEQLEKALERLMGNPELRRRLGEAARKRVASEFSAAQYLEHYVGLVSAALGRQA